MTSRRGGVPPAIGTMCSSWKIWQKELKGLRFQQHLLVNCHATRDMSLRVTAPMHPNGQYSAFELYWDSNGFNPERDIPVKNDCRSARCWQLSPVDTIKAYVRQSKIVTKHVHDTLRYLRDIAGNSAV